MTQKLLQLIQRKTTIRDQRSIYGMIAGIFGIISNLILFIMKIIIGIMSNSVSIIADAVNNLFDSTSSLITFIGFIISAKPADKQHPFGHQRFEYISGLFISIIICFVGLNFLTESFQRIINPSLLSMNFMMFVILLLSIIIKFGQSLYYRKLSQQIDSQTLRTNATDSLNDILTTGVVLIGMLIQYFFNYAVDGWIGLFIAIFIIYSGSKSLIDFSNNLLGQRPDQATIDLIKHKLECCHKIHGFHDLMIHSYGPNQIYATVDIELPDNLSLSESHKIIDKIETDFKVNLGIHLAIHLDPISTARDFHHYQQQIITLVQEVDQRLSIHDFRIVKDKYDQLLIFFDVVVGEEITIDDNSLLSQLEATIKKRIPDCILHITLDRHYLLA